MATINGTLGDDALNGTEEADTVNAQAGADTVAGAGGDDTIYGQEGNDRLAGNQGNDTIDGGANDDTVFGGAGDDTLYGGTQNDTIYGGDGNDTIYGGADDDTLFGGAGNDTIYGIYGLDYIDGGAGDDAIYLDGYGGKSKVVAFGNGAGADAVYDWEPDLDYVYIGDLDPADITITKLGDKLFVLSIAGGDPNDSLTLEFNYSALLPTTEDIRTRLLTSAQYSAMVACFTPGARIMTAAGFVAVERLKRGDILVTRDHGHMPIWRVARRFVEASEARASPAFWPVTIPMGALGHGRPFRDIAVSRQHAFLCECGRGLALLRATHLPPSCPQVRDAQPPSLDVLYIHLVMARHEILNVEGVWTESFFSGPASKDLVSLDAPQMSRAYPLLTRADLRALPCPPTLLPAQDVAPTDLAT